ncbi:three component ABC system middle component [Pectobacterium actinidiae]|uniref:Three component ABC system middle component n=1 Tax=Pectobacterium actinidiae TaxID=1507808 RepID=A0ABW8GB06_9GAMM
MFYKDKNIINNSSLSCFLLVLFSEEYEKLSVDNRYPDLMQYLIILPFVWHKISREAIKTKRSSTPLDIVILESQLIKYNFKERVIDYTGATLQGLNFAVSSGLLIKFEENNKILFKRGLKKWPPNVKKTLPADMSKTITRLANWFYHMDTSSIYSLLLGK